MKFCVFALISAVLFAEEAPKLRLPGDIIPVRYSLHLNLIPARDGYNGSIAIEVQVKKTTSVIWLNSTGLKISSAKIGGKTTKVIPGNSDFIGLQGEKAFAVGPTRIDIAFSGGLATTDVEGLFKQTDGGDSYILTQFEPISARRAFPCFDEPGLKTPWNITLRIPKDLLAFANTPIRDERVEGATKIVRFRESKPLPSYLVAMAVGPFEIIDGGTAGRNKTPLRVIATRGHKDEAKFVLETTPKVFGALEDYFGMPYPYEKLDQITIPVTVAFGAMENAGLITYASNILLIRPQDDTVSRRRSTANIITHEIAHQWFGNMVSPAWWDDIWLNEAFATWMTNNILNRQFPEWRSDVTAVARKSQVMGEDSLLSARKIRQPITSDGDIGSAFDGITYEKGAAVIHMFENYVGPELFQKGIRQYMQKHAWGAATARDFMAAIGQASRKDVTSAFSTFLDRTGVPFLSVTLKCAPAVKPTVVVTQERFLPLGSKGARGEFWQVPTCFEYDADGKTARQCGVIADPKDTVTLASARGCPAWINANDGGSGYYRVRYEGGLQGKLIENVNRLEPKEQLETLTNAAALLRAGQMPASEALALIPKFKDSANRQIVMAAVGMAESVKRSVPDELKPNYARFMLAMFDARAKQLGFEPKSGESDDARLLRPMLLDVAAENGDRELSAKAKEVAAKWLNDRKSVSADVASVALEIAAANGDRAFFDRLVAELRKSKDRRDRNKIVDALGSFRNPALAQEGLRLLLDPTLDIRDVSELLTAYNDEPETEKLSWPFLVANYNRILARLPSRLGNHAGSDLPEVGGAFCDANGYAEVQNFFKDRAKKMPGAELTLAQTLEAIQLCEPRRAAQKPEVAKFLAKW